jgi:LDH2 family malate/lactate/ureidoglycolate dehydrogenase
MVGTNPIGISVPSTADPLVLDMSTASVSMGKVLEQAGRQGSIPLGWAIDRHGNPTTDPTEASSGAISPFGGAKGYALGIAFEALVAVLTQSALGTGVKGTLDNDQVCSKGDVFLSISIDRLGLRSALPGLTAYLDEVRASGASPGAVAVPGDRARFIRQRRLAAGVPLHSDVWAQVLELHREAVHG